MKEIGTSGAVSRENYQDWPLFKKFRKTRHFIDTYREIFNAEIEIKGVPPEVASALSATTENLKETTASVSAIRLAPLPKKVSQPVKRVKPRRTN